MTYEVSIRTPRVEYVSPKQSYLICATPRTGSTLLCDVLIKTQMMGMPREYFECLKATALPRQPIQYFVPCEERGWNTAAIFRLLGMPKLRVDRKRVEEIRRFGYKHYLKEVLREGTTGNGVFGAKIMWGHLCDFLDHLTGSADLSSSERLSEHLHSSFPNLKFIYVSREDKLRQAVSLWTAIQTQQWRVDEEASASSPLRAPVFDFRAIDYLRRRLVEQDNAWDAFFGEAKIEPLALRYEQFARNLEPTMTRIAEHIRVSDIGSLFAASSMRKQSDERTERWIEQYLKASRPSS